MPVAAYWLVAPNVIIALIGSWWFTRTFKIECSCARKSEGYLRIKVVGGITLGKDFVDYFIAGVETNCDHFVDRILLEDFEVAGTHGAVTARVRNSCFELTIFADAVRAQEVTAWLAERKRVGVVEGWTCARLVEKFTGTLKGDKGLHSKMLGDAVTKAEESEGPPSDIRQPEHRRRRIQDDYGDSWWDQGVAPTRFWYPQRRREIPDVDAPEPPMPFELEATAKPADLNDWCSCCNCGMATGIAIAIFCENCGDNTCWSPASLQSRQNDPSILCRCCWNCETWPLDARMLDASGSAAPQLACRSTPLACSQGASSITTGVMLVKDAWGCCGCADVMPTRNFNDCDGGIGG